MPAYVTIQYLDFHLLFGFNSWVALCMCVMTNATDSDLEFSLYYWDVWCLHVHAAMGLWPMVTGERLTHLWLCPVMQHSRLVSVVWTIASLRKEKEAHCASLKPISEKDNIKRRWTRYVRKYYIRFVEICTLGTCNALTNCPLILFASIGRPCWRWGREISLEITEIWLLFFTAFSKLLKLQVNKNLT
jgi:hypothetical protein